MVKKEKMQDKSPLELRPYLLEAMLDHVPFDGWSKRAMGGAANDLGLKGEMAELAFPEGPIEMLEEHLKTADAELVSALEKMNLSEMKIRDRITTIVRTRLELSEPRREVVRRGLAVLAQPCHTSLAAKSLWATADTMWRAAGDTSTDHNWYTKRMTLSGVYSSVLLYWMNDESEDRTDTWAFLDRRIEDVMRIEKIKFEGQKLMENMPSISRFLSRLRYGAH